MTDDKHLTTSDDLYRFELVSDPQLSPDGRAVVLCVQRVDRATEKKVTNLWLAATDGSRLRQFTHGKQADTHPRWSPDGQTIAFLSNRGNEEQAQIYLIPLDGGEARPLTDLKGSFASFEWSPDGATLACQFRKKDPDALEREKDEQKKKLGISHRTISRYFYKNDGASYAPDEKWHVWTVDAGTGEAAQLTDGDYDETDPRWSPAGGPLAGHILFVSNRSADPDANLDETEFYVVPAGGGDLRRVDARPGRKMAPSFSPDGRHIAYYGRPEKGRWYQNARLYVAAADGSGTRDVSGPSDLHLVGATTGDISSDFPPVAPVWSADGSRVYVVATRHGDQPLMAYDLDSGAAERLTPERGVAGSFSFDAARNRVAYFWSDLANPGQIMVREVGAAPRQLTRFNCDWLGALELGEVEELWFKARDGYDLQGWILKPPGFDPTRQYPSILEIHGGPQMQYGNLFTHEFYLLAAQGYVVCWTNPRGSQGYGEAHAGAIYGRWGTVDYDDMMDWADYVEQLPYIDPARMGVTGGSYGGYMTTLIIGRTQRFKAAVAQRVVSNLLSFYGSSDLNYGTEYLVGIDAPPWEAFDDYWQQSPISYIGAARTPTLVIHSENDYRCDQEQGEQVFIALKRLGVDTELLLLPGESHGVSRGGRTDRRVARLDGITDWFKRYLPA
jgi:dipeptidyl aminopeptidase/acylaminoacyl peptidase